MYNYYKGFYSFSPEQEFEFLKVCFRGDFLKGLPEEKRNDIKKSIVVHLRPPVRGEGIKELQNPKNISWQSEDNEDFSFERTIYAKERETDFNFQDQAARTSQLLVEKRKKIAFRVQCIFMVALVLRCPLREVELEFQSRKNAIDFIEMKSDECHKHLQNTVLEFSISFQDSGRANL